MNEPLSKIKNEGHAGEINSFIQAILGKKELLVDGRQGRNAIELIMAMYKPGNMRG